jgi:hypothetical protein
MRELSRRELLYSIGGLLAATRLRAQEAAAALSIDQLACMGWPQLEAMYRASGPGTIPCGPTRGVTIPCLSSKFGKTQQCVSGLLWKGKTFDPACEELTNRWLIGKGVKAHVFIGPSWIDDGLAIISDYQGTSPIVWKNIRDEIREVSPGVYLGAMIRRACPEPQFKMFFALELCAAKASCKDSSGGCAG